MRHRGWIRTALAALVAAGFAALPAHAAAGVARMPDGRLAVASSNDVEAWNGEFGPGTIIAGGRDGGFAGDGGPASAARLNGPSGIATDPGGGLLVADTGNNRVRRIDPDGTIHTVAGGGIDSYGCLATRTYLDQPTTVAPTGDGGFITVSDGSRVARVWPDGSMTEIGADARLWAVQDAAPEADGSVLIVEDNQVMRVHPDGSHEIVAGFGGVGHDGDGGPATEATFGWLRAVAPLADGGFLLMDDSDGGGLRRVRPDGTIETYEQMDYPNAIALDPGGGVVVADHWLGTVTDYPDRSLKAAALPGGPAGGTGGVGGGCTGLDPTFAGGGLTAADLPDVPSGVPGMVREPNGRLVLAGVGGFGVGALNEDGTVDRSFGSAGATIVSGEHGQATALVRQSSGRIVMAGMTGDGMAVAGLRPDGTLDPSFGEDGVYSNPDQPSPQLAVGPGDRLYIGLNGGLMRLTADGSPDPTFGDGGFVSGTAGPAVAVLPGGDAVTIGDMFEMSRVRPDGSVDAGFRPANPVRGRSTIWNALAVDDQGRIVAVGDDEGSATSAGFVYRILPDGRPDPSFGDDGLVTIDHAPRFAGLVFQGDRMVLLGGAGGLGTTRLLPDGRPDPAWGPGGERLTPVGDLGGLTAGTALPDGRLVLAGSMYPSVPIAARYLADPAPDPTATPDPTPDPASGGGAGPVTGSGGVGPTGAPPADPPAQPAGPARVATAIRLRLARAAVGRRWVRARLTAPAGRVALSLRRGGRVVARRSLTVRRAGTRTVRLRRRSAGRLVLVARQGSARARVTLRPSH